MQEDDNISPEDVSPEAAVADQATVDRRARMQKRRKFLLSLLVLIFLAVGIAYGVYWMLVLRYYASTDDAYVHGNKIMLTPQIAGTVVSVGADDTDLVHAGQFVIKLNQSNTRVALAKAKANLAQTVRHVRQLYEQEAVQEQAIKKIKTQITQTRRDFERNQHLVKINGISRKQFQHSSVALKVARANLSMARHKLKALQALTQGTDLRHNPQVQLAEAQLREADLNQMRTQVPAPVTGYVAMRNAQVGQKVTPAKPMMAIVPLNQVWVEANFKETDVAKMRIGQPVTLHADFYGSDVTYDGTVAGISAGSGSAFELLPPQNATGNWIKVVRRVPVRIHLDPEQVKKHPLRLGLSMSVKVDEHDTSGDVLAKTPPPKPVYTTHVYSKRKSDAERMIQRIIKANKVAENDDG